jgi:hypothetical protein
MNWRRQPRAIKDRKKRGTTSTEAFNGMNRGEIYGSSVRLNQQGLRCTVKFRGRLRNGP